MRNQLHRWTRADAAKERREYLQKIAVAHSSAIVCGGLAVFLGLLTLLCILCLIYVTFFSDQVGRNVNGPFLAFLVLGSAASFFGRRAQTHLNRAKAVPYVPPVAEQVATLPADEILLRGSDQPAAEPDELLRAAHEGTETPPDQLLRAEQTPADSQ